MRLKTPGFGLIALGILLLGAQLVLYVGYKNVHPTPGQESHIEPAQRTTFLPGLFGLALLVSGFILSVRNPREADDPSDGRSVPNEVRGERSVRSRRPVQTDERSRLKL